MLTKNNNQFWLLSLILLLVVAYFIYNSLLKPIGDFGNYYYASNFLVQGNWGLWIYDPASFNLKIYELGQHNVFLNYSPVPPLSAIIYTPFTLISVKWAKLIWNVFNCGLLLVTIYRLQKHHQVALTFWYAFPILFFVPMRNCINEGQSYFLILYLLAEGFIQYQKGNFWIMATLWALSIHLKISPAFVFLFLLFNKEYKGALALILVSVGMLIVSLPILSFSIWHQYLNDILPRLFKGEINNTYALNYQSAQVLLKTIFVPDGLHNTNDLFNNPEMYHRLLFMFKTFVVGITIIASFSIHNQSIKFSFWLICSFLISGYGNSFSLLLLVLPAVYFYPLLKANRLYMALFIACLLVTANIPFYWFAQLEVPLRFPRLYALFAMFIIMIIVTKTKLKWFYGLVILTAIFWPIHYELYIQNYFLEKEKTLLTYDFTVTGNDVVINSFDENGPFVNTVPLGFSVYQLQWVTPSKKYTYLREKACIINDSLMLNLSDKNRGVGFYTIRKKAINIAQK